MAKKGLLVLVLAGALAGMGFGQTEEGQTWPNYYTPKEESPNWLNSFAPGIEDSKWFINGGVGYGILPNEEDISLLTFSASVEYKLGLANRPLSIGAYFGMAGYDKKTEWYRHEATLTAIGARLSWHFNFLKNLDAYASFTAGYLVHPQKVEGYIDGKVITSEEHQKGTFLIGAHLGARYFFTNAIGAYVEIGYSAISLASAGLALKF
jgi:hypothetical protein